MLNSTIFVKISSLNLYNLLIFAKLTFPYFPHISFDVDKIRYKGFPLKHYSSYGDFRENRCSEKFPFPKKTVYFYLEILGINSRNMKIVSLTVALSSNLKKAILTSK